jgi:peptidoglycan-N-acetylglucosamine deacetylase
MRFQVFGAAVFAMVYSAANAAECAYTAAKSELSRVVAIDSVNGPVYGHTKTSDGPLDAATPEAASPIVLNDKEIVLTFDQGPHSAYTKYILDILDHHCVKATFFFSGKAALENSAPVRDAERRGNTIAAEPWSTGALDKLPFESAKVEIEKGLTAVGKAANAPVAPFLRVTSANMPPEILAYLHERGVSLWFYDLPAGDNEPGITASQLANRTLARIRAKGRGVIQFHDNRKVTVDALDSILTGAKLSGFKVVHIVPAAAFAPKDEYVMAVRRSATAPVIAASSGASHHLVESATRRVRAYDDGLAVPPAAGPKKNKSEPINGCGSACAQ